MIVDKPNSDFPKYIKYGNAVCILIGWDYINGDICRVSAKYTGYDDKHRPVVLLMTRDMMFYHTKIYVDSKLICECVLSEKLYPISASEFYDNAKGPKAYYFKEIAREDMLKENKYLKWTI